MADNINLIPAAELPLTEADEVDVLCVEGGELKRKAAANLGGGGGYIINVPEDELTEGDEGMQIMLSESRDNFAPILAAGGSVWVKIPFAGQEMYIAVSAWVFVSGGLVLMATFNSMMVQIACPNGTWTPEAEA